MCRRYDPVVINSYIAALLPQALPWRATPLEQTFNMASWQPTVHGTRAICKILAAIVLAHGDVLPHGGWDAAVQRVRWAVLQLCATLHAALVALHPMSCASWQESMRICHMPHEASPFLPL